MKQQILEREKLKLQRTIANNTSSKDNGNKSRSLKANVTIPPQKSPGENLAAHIKQNQIKSKELETVGHQQSETRKRTVDIASKNMPLLNAPRVSSATSKHFSENIVKHAVVNSVCQTKEIKKTIPTNLSIRITNEIAPHSHAGSKLPTDNSSEKQSNDNKQQQQQHRPALRVLNKDEINHKSVQVMLKMDKIGRVVTLNDNKLSLLHDTASTSHVQKSIENNIGAESTNERDKNNENNNGAFANNASTAILPDLSVSSRRQELDDTLENTMSRSQYEAECRRETTRNISASPALENSDSNSFSRLSEVSANDNKGSGTDDETVLVKKGARIETELNSLANLSEAEQQQYLRDTEHKLVAKR